MKSSFKFFAVIWLIALILFNAIVFTLGNEMGIEFGGSFWIGYTFVTISFLGHLACAYQAFRHENLTKVFYNLPLVSISYGSLIGSFLFGAIFMSLGLPAWLCGLASLVILGINAISVLKVSVAADVVQKIDQKTKTQTFFISYLSAEAERLNNHCSAELKPLCTKVYEAIRYSDPMSVQELVGVEGTIKNLFDSFAAAVKGGDAARANLLAADLLENVEVRNARCKLLK